MKKILLILMFSTQFLFAQERLGYSYKDIVLEWSPSPMSYENNRDGNLVLNVELSYANVVYEFNSDSVCLVTKIYPKTNKDLKMLIAQNDATCISVSCGVWMGVFRDGMASCKLVDGKYFVWNIEYYVNSNE